jgi:hypothetical protein
LYYYESNNFKSFFSMKIKKIFFLVSFVSLYNVNLLPGSQDASNQKHIPSQWEFVISLLGVSTTLCLLGSMIRDVYIKSQFKKKIKKLFQKKALKKLVVDRFNESGHLFQVYNLVTSSQAQSTISYSSKNEFGVAMSEGGGFCSAGMLQFKERVYVILYKLLSELKLNADFLGIVKEIDRTSLISFSIETVLLEVLSDANFMLRLAATV